ncbi:MAG: hypothetical protein OFPI_06690 [Osedax symbiont Rs2]|nr:MAG: hypothetical protein OFPI_06690 [Osedax symbiont Rs2]
MGWGILPVFWGMGLAQEAATAALHWGMNNLKKKSICSLVHPQNSASMKLAKKLGQSYSHNQKVADKEVQVYKISRREFLGKQDTENNR